MIFLKDLAQKTRRGQMGRVKAGRIPGGRSYGYDVVPSGDDRGRRIINEKEAAIVRRIFDEYALRKRRVSFWGYCCRQQLGFLGLATFIGAGVENENRAKDVSQLRT